MRLYLFDDKLSKYIAILLNMKVEIIAIGDELLIGQTIDTNSAWIGEQLNALSFEMVQISKIQDDKDRILEALKLQMQQMELLL